MQTNTDYKISQNLALLVVGEPKVGKTRLMMAFPDPFVLDLDKNLGSAVQISKSKRFWFSQVDNVPDGEQWSLCMKELEAACKMPEVKTICIDGLTRLADVARAHILHELTKMGLGGKLRQDTIDQQIRLQDYQTLNNLILRVVALTRASNKFVVWTAHQKVDQDEITGAMRYRFQMPGNLASNLGGYFTDVWAMTAGPAIVGTRSVTKYEIRTKPTGFHVSLGASIPLEPSIDITDKNPEEIWKVLGPKLTPT